MVKTTIINGEEVPVLPAKSEEEILNKKLVLNMLVKKNLTLMLQIQIQKLLPKIYK
jgi:hypothetical protein